jgi:peptide/nickel transport system substrate-binding protein
MTLLRLSCRRIYQAITLPAAAAAMLASAAPAFAGGTLVWGLPVGVSVLDPHVSCGWMAKFVDYQMFEGLVEIDLTRPEAPTQFKGQLAESWDISEDGLIYTFNLRQGVTFHDGTPFDADAVKFNFERFLNPEAPHYSETANGYFAFAGITPLIKSVDVLDAATVQITLNEPNNQFLRLGMEDCPQMYMISPKAIMEYGEEGLALHPVGTGPFKFVARQPGVSIELERNDEYWGEAPGLDQIVFRELEDPATRMNAFYAGEINAIQDPVWDEIENLIDEGYTVTTNEDAPALWYMSLNMQHPQLADPRVRQAINLAIDREGLVEEVLRGYARPAYTMLNAGTFAHDRNYVSYPYDPERAKQLLAEAGAENLVLTFELPKYGFGELVEKWVQRDLAKVGIETNLVAMEWLAYLDKWNAGMTPDIAFTDMIWGMQTPEWTSITYRCNSQPPNGWNNAWACNEQSDELLNAAVRKLDLEEAASLYQEADRLMMGDPAYAPLYHYFNPIALDPSVKGFVNAPANWWDLSTISIEE